MVFRDFFGFGPKWYLSLVWGVANRAVAYDHPFCNNVEKTALSSTFHVIIICFVYKDSCY